MRTMLDPFSIPLRDSAEVEVPGVDGALTIFRETEQSWLVSRPANARSPLVARIRLTPDGWHADSLHGAGDTDDTTVWERAVDAAAHFPTHMHPARRIAVGCCGLVLAVTVATLLYGVVSTDPGLTPLVVNLIAEIVLMAVATAALIVGRVTRHWDPVTGRWSRLSR